MLPRILAIETSCDETACAIWAEGRICGERVHLQRHADFGGVVPEMASRAHCRHLLPLVAELLSETNITPTHIAYTRGPGLSGALLTGAATACALAFARQIPALPINHLTGHLLSPHLSADDFAFPYLALLISGGHTQLWEVQSPLDFRILGATLDDAAGEAFDKTAVLLGLNYPGGAALEALANGGAADSVALPSPVQPQLNFSFSGLKTAVRRHIERTAADNTKTDGESTRWRTDIAASFQHVVAEGLGKQSAAACRQTAISRLAVVGGVAQNHAVWQALEKHCGTQSVIGARLHRPHPKHCGDNAAMIAQAAAMQLQAKEAAGIAADTNDDYAFDVAPRWLETAEG